MVKNTQQRVTRPLAWNIMGRKGAQKSWVIGGKASLDRLDTLVPPVAQRDTFVHIV